jgi:hypothetical protein
MPKKEKQKQFSYEQLAKLQEDYIKKLVDDYIKEHPEISDYSLPPETHPFY